MNNIQSQFPSVNVTKTGNKNGRSPDAPPYDHRSTEWNAEREEFARHKAYKLHKELFKTKGHCRDAHNTNFFRSYVSTEEKNTATGLAMHSKEKVYIVDSGASLHMIILSGSQRKEDLSIVKQNSGYSDRQWRCGLHQGT